MMLHPELQKMLAAFRESGRPALSAGTPADARALIAAGREAMGPGPQLGRVEDVALAGRGGAIGARLYQADAPPLGLLVYLHGGGWVAGALDDFDGLARHLCRRSGWAVLSVDYRLAPEHPFPAALEDVEDALRAAWAHRVEWLGAPRPMAVGGDSAGGNLATVAAASLRDELPLALQLLIYPVVDAAMDTPSYAAHGEGLSLTAADMRWFFDHYAPPALRSDPRISPLRQPRLEGVAPAWIATAEFDVLCDEAQAYAQALSDAGVAVRLRRYAGMMHGFARMMNFIDVADRMVDDAAAALREAAGHDIQSARKQGT